MDSDARTRSEYRPGPMAAARRARRVLSLAASIVVFLIHARIESPSVYDGTRLNLLTDSGLSHIQVLQHDDGNVRISFGLHEYNESALTRFAGVPSRLNE